jgi:hypothetical protein
LIYEINTWPWLAELSRLEGRSLTLASVPDAEWDRVVALGFNAVWLMGVWERSPAGIALANRNSALLAELRRVLPDYQPADNVGSAYSVRRYRVAHQLGGREGLAAARAALARRGVRLILDFVPNHVAPDHPWVEEHPEYLIQGDATDRRRAPDAFVRRRGRIFACGRDPYFPPWGDVLQLNVFDGGLRAAAAETLKEIADQCDGVRCDMAMLVLNSVFERSWGARAGKRPTAEYWEELIPAVRARHPGFQFIAEAYWDLERELLRQGFDFCYDKRVYDCLARGEAEALHAHLAASSADQKRLVHFVENHDEPRLATRFVRDHARAAAVALMTLPGVQLFHEGQIEGRQIHLPVCLGRRPTEPVDSDWGDFYGRVLAAGRAAIFREGEWRLCEVSGWPGNAGDRGLVAWSWSRGNDRCLVVVNLSAARSQGKVRMPWLDLGGRCWRLEEVLSSEIYTRDGEELVASGLYVELADFGFHWFKVE